MRLDHKVSKLSSAKSMKEHKKRNTMITLERILMGPFRFNTILRCGLIGVFAGIFRLTGSYRGFISYLA